MQRSDAELWREQTELFALFIQTNPHLEPMLEFVRWLASQHSETLTPTLSHFALMLEAPAYRAQSRYRVIVETNYDDTFSVRYRANNGDEMAKICAHDEIQTAIEAWLMRLEIEMEVFENFDFSAR